MSRPLRINVNNAIYHVMGRGRGRQLIYHGDDYYQTYLNCLKEAHQRFNLHILAYCLMGNHYHLLVQTPEANLSRGMRHINGLYTQRYNRMRKTDGSLFRGRYKAILIDSDSYLLQVSRYIHRNPVELEKPLVKDLADYRWSSYPCYLNNEQAPSWLDRETVLMTLNSSRRFQVYREYVLVGLDEQTATFYARKSLPGIWGGKDFIKGLGNKIRPKDKEVSLKLVVERPSMQAVIAAVARYYGCDEMTICHSTRGRGRKNIPRWIAMYLCQEASGETLSRIAIVFNVGHYSTVSQTIGRLKKEMMDDKNLLKIINMLSQDLTL